MAFTRTTTINSAPGGDSTKQAVLDLDTDLTGAFGYLNTHDHSGGDGAQIAYSGLSGLPALGSMAAQNTSTYAGPGSSQAFSVGALTATSYNQTGNSIFNQTSGNLLVGTTTDDGVNKLQVNGGIATRGGGVVRVARSGYESTLYGELGYNSAGMTCAAVEGYHTWKMGNIATGTTQMTLDASGNLTISGATATKASGTTWANPSDARLKANVQDYQRGLYDVIRIRPVTGEYNGKGGTPSGTRFVSIIAQEMQQIAPETITTFAAKLNDDDKTTTELLKFDGGSDVIWMLVNAVKELKAEVDQLGEQLNAA